MKWQPNKIGRTVSRLTELAIFTFAIARPAPAGAGSKCFKTRFIPSNGVVQDVATGLTWDRATAPGAYTGDNALAYCKNLTLAPGGWRVPSASELVSLLDFERAVPGPLIDDVVFSNTLPEPYWTSTAYPDSVFLTYVDFGRGISGQQVRYDTNSQYRVRCVR